MSELKLLSKWVLVEPMKWYLDDTVKCGIILPRNVSILNRGTVLAVGKHVVGIEVGDIVHVVGSVNGIDTRYGKLVREKDVVFKGEGEVYAPSFS